MEDNSQATPLGQGASPRSPQGHLQRCYPAIPCLLSLGSLLRAGWKWGRWRHCLSSGLLGLLSAEVRASAGLFLPHLICKRKMRSKGRESCCDSPSHWSRHTSSPRSPQWRTGGGPGADTSFHERKNPACDMMSNFQPSNCPGRPRPLNSALPKWREQGGGPPAGRALKARSMSPACVEDGFAWETQEFPYSAHQACLLMTALGVRHF